MSHLSILLMFTRILLNGNLIHFYNVLSPYVNNFTYVSISTLLLVLCTLFLYYIVIIIYITGPGGKQLADPVILYKHVLNKKEK